jgi:hypothetical protein
MTLVRVLSPDTEPELVAVVAMLEAHEIPCFVHNHAFGSLYPGPQINAYNTRSIMVAEENVPDAIELIREFQAHPGSAQPRPTPSGRLRNLIEFLLFGWFIPGSRASVRGRPDADER